MTVQGVAFRNLIKNSSMVFLLNLAGVAVSVLTIPITLRIIGVASYGHLVLVQAIALAVFTLCGLQYWQGLLVTLPGRQVTASLLKRQVWISFRYELLGMAAVTLTMVLLQGLALAQTVEFSLAQLLLLACSAVLPVVGTHTAYFRLVNRYAVLLGAGLLANVLKLLLLHLLASHAPTLGQLVLVYALPEIARCVLLFAYIYRASQALHGASPLPVDSDRHIRQAGRWSTVQAICDLPVQQVDRIIIGFAISGDQLGIFHILKRIYSMVNLATAPFYSTSIPEFAARVNAGDLPGAFQLWRKTMQLLLAVTALAALACYVLKSLWMPWIYAGLSNYLPEFTVVLVTAVLAGTFITTHSLYWALGKQRQSALITVGANLLYLAVLLGLSLSAGLLGAVLAFLCQVAMIGAVKAVLLSKIRRSCA